MVKHSSLFRSKKSFYWHRHQVLAAVEISTLLIRVRPNLETLAVLQEAEAFPGNDAEGLLFLLSCIYASDFAIHMLQQTQ